MMKQVISKYKTPILVSAGLIAGLLLGSLFFSGSQPSKSIMAEEHIHPADTEYTCSMHPQVRQNEPGSCPICGMDLVPVSSISTGDKKALQMTDEAIKLASISTTIVGGEPRVKEVQLSGRLRINENKSFRQTSHFSGRVETLRVRSRGEKVSEGQIIAGIYSPALITAQEELLEAFKYRESNPDLWAAARKKLGNLKIPERTVLEIEETGVIRTELGLYSQYSGTVTEMMVKEGDHLREGQALYTVAALNELWISLDAYENDLKWIGVGNNVHFEVPSQPGRHFHAKIIFVDPVINPITRTTEVRAVVTNTDGRLKPDMFVRGLVVAPSGGQPTKLTVLKSSVLWTGIRSIVYVKDPGSVNSFMMREVLLGADLGEAYEIVSGLEQGEEVVTHGVFTIDAASQLQNKPSMMNPSGEVMPAGHDHGAMGSSSSETEDMLLRQTEKKDPVDEAFRGQLTAVFTTYLAITDALVNSDADEAGNQAKTLLDQLNGVDMSLVNGEAHNKWMSLLIKLRSSTQQIAESSQLEVKRNAYSELSNSLYEAIKYFGVSGLNAFYQYCPMSKNNQGAFWLSTTEEINNPYFGAAMLRCGETIETL